MPTLHLLCCLLAVLALESASAEQPSLQVANLMSDTGIDAYIDASPDRWQALDPRKLKLKSIAALVTDGSGNEIYAKQVDEPRPIASITKLMTAMVILDGDLPLDEKISIVKDDRDLIQLTGSRLHYGATLTREELLRLALMSSENRAANALGRTWPGGKAAFVEAMNRKAARLGMHSSRFIDPAGLDPGNVASARDVEKMVRASLTYPLIRKATTTRSLNVHPYKRKGPLRYNNTNRLLGNGAWTIEVSKTGYLDEAGRCLAMQAEIAERHLVIILLDSYGKRTPYKDSRRIRQWIEHGING